MRAEPPLNRGSSTAPSGLAAGRDVPLSLGSSTAPAGSVKGHDAEARIQRACELAGDPLNLGSSTPPAGLARGHDAEARIQPISGRTPAQERMAALRARVQAREMSGS